MMKDQEFLKVWRKNCLLLQSDVSAKVKKEILEAIPKGVEFVESINPEWYKKKHPAVMLCRGCDPLFEFLTEEERNNTYATFTPQELVSMGLALELGDGNPERHSVEARFFFEYCWVELVSLCESVSHGVPLVSAAA